MPDVLNCFALCVQIKATHIMLLRMQSNKRRLLRMFSSGKDAVNELLKKRRDGTTTRIGELRQNLGEAETRCGDSASVYATGSFARGEASQHSDLDLFIAGQGTPEKPALSRLDEILVKADLIEATRELRIPDFSGDGQYLIHYTSEELVGTLGQPEDDARNTFTAPLLLLLVRPPPLESPRSTYTNNQ